MEGFDGMLMRQHHEGIVKIRKEEGLKYHVHRGSNTSGEFGIVCPSPYVSKNHCIISVKNNAFWIKDCKSTNGTYLNGEKIAGIRELRFGDVIGLGVSHTDDDPLINVTDPKFFVYSFAPFFAKQYRRGGSPSGSKSSVKTEDSADINDIEVIYEKPASSVSGSDNASTSSFKTKRPMPPAPPPPILTKDVSSSKSSLSGQRSSTSNLQNQKPSTSKGNSEQSHNKPIKEDISIRPSGPAASTVTQKISLKNKNADSANASSKDSSGIASVQDEHVRFEKQKSKPSVFHRSSSISSDDSSDGLGDVDDSKHLTSAHRASVDETGKGKSSAYSGVSSSSESSSDDDQRKQDQVRKPHWKRIRSISNSSSLSAADSENNNVSPARSSDIDSEKDDTLRNEETNQIKECNIMVERIIYVNNGRTKLAKCLRNMDSRIRHKVKSQFKESLFKMDNSKKASPGQEKHLLSTSVPKKRIPSPIPCDSDSEEEESSSRKDNSTKLNVDKTKLSQPTPIHNKRRKSLSPIPCDSDSEEEESSSRKDNSTKLNVDKTKLSQPTPIHNKRRKPLSPIPCDSDEEDQSYFVPILPKMHKRPKIRDEEVKRCVDKVKDGERESENENVEMDFDGEEMDVDDNDEAFGRKKSDITVGKSSKHSTISAPSNEYLQTPTRERVTVPRGIQLIDNFPQPRFAAILQSKSAPFAFKKPAPPSTSNIKTVLSNKSPITTQYSKPFMTKEEQKQLRNKKLREMEIKKRQEREKEEAPKKVKQPAKIKITKRNRNQELMESIAGEKFNDADSVIGEPVPKQRDSSSARGIHSALPATLKAAAETNPQELRIGAEPTIKICDPRLERKNSSSMPSVPNLPVPSMSKPQQFPTPAPGVTNGGPLLLKPGAGVILSPPGRVEPVPYREISTNSIWRKQHNQSLPPPFTSEDEIYKKMVSWMPIWFEEQKKRDSPPPIYNLDEIHSTLKTYLSFEVYFNTYYPLLLNEIWATISNEAEKKPAPSDDSSFKSRVCEYKVKIDEAKPTNICPLIKINKKPDKEEFWLSIRYHTWVKNINEIDTKKDFLRLSVVGKEKLLGGTKDKSFFAFSVFNTENYVPVSKNIDVDPRLMGKGSNGFRFTERIVCKFRSSYAIDLSRIGQVERLCHITPKIREFKALNMLHSFPLYQNIVTPPESVKNSWQSWSANPNTNPQELLTVCRKMQLNSEQRLMIAYIINRVFSHDPELMLMHGPPGTGKTLTIVCLVLQLLFESKKRRPGSNNRRILICTPSNAAVDEIMRRLIQVRDQLPSTFNGGKRLEIVRIGEGYSKEVEPYCLNAKVKAMDAEKSTAISLKVELSAIEEDIKERKQQIEKLKSEEGSNMVQLHSKLSMLHELEAKKEALQADLDLTTKRKHSKDNNDQRRADVIRDADIICSTLGASSNSLMKNVCIKISQSKDKPFLCCIVDEASQTTEPESLLPLVLDIDKLLLVGDPHQLGATVLSSLAEDKGYGQSLFSRLYEFYIRRKGDHPIMMLKQQYRMHEEIVRWPNDFYYENQLKTMYRPVRQDYPLRPYYFLDLMAGREQADAGQIENVKEVELVKTVIDVLEDVLLSTNAQWSIGVITPYSKQRSLLKKEFFNQNFRSFKSIEIDTIDGFQGQEKDIIILSCVRTDATGFLKSRNRLNVALTRAKHSLYIIGDARCLAKDEMWRCLIQDAANRNCKYDVQSELAANNKKLLNVTLKGKLKVPNGTMNKD